ncbi:WbqC family protein [Apibacter raozihei]|uniref:WbqC family protein n=1 Tax=Apibacter TaxID=1778601 RepID=UPI000FE2FA42|nr:MULTISPECIES: WbqC family protein [Apibacter]
MTVLPIFYFAPVSYFALALQSDKLLLEKWENFPKQTYRNRCIIQGANGKLPLIIPTEHTGARIFKDIKISYASNWMNLHWKSIKSSYQSSPYFEYYQDSLKEIFDKKETYLIDFNLKTFQWINDKVKLNLDYDFTLEYNEFFEGKDARETFNAKKESTFQNQPYIQVFSDRFEFMNDLSILDLVCNVGPKCDTYISNI